MTLELKLPESMPLSKAQFQSFQMLNIGSEICLKENKLSIEEAGVLFSQMDFIDLNFPYEISEEQYFAFCELNSEKFKKIEYHQNKIQINMATIGFISAFSMLIGYVLISWNRKNKFGQVYDAQGDFIMPNGNHKIPDIALVEFTDKLYNEKGFIIAKPFLIIEVVSNKYSLQKDLKKVAEHWMPNQTKIALVVDPHRKEYHIFTQKTELYKTIPFSEPFKHNKLPKLEINFEELLTEAKGEQTK